MDYYIFLFRFLIVENFLYKVISTSVYTSGPIFNTRQYISKIYLNLWKYNQIKPPRKSTSIL